MGDDGVSQVQSFDLGEADASTGNPAELAQAAAPLREARFAYAEAEKNLGDMLMRSMRSQKPKDRMSPPGKAIEDKKEPDKPNAPVVDHREQSSDPRILCRIPRPIRR